MALSRRFDGLTAVDDLRLVVDEGAPFGLIGLTGAGKTQRLARAGTLIHAPPVLLLDEPASGLDPRGRLEMRELLRELRAMGKTTLISSHILSELADVCTHVGIMDRGRLVLSGTVAE